MKRFVGVDETGRVYVSTTSIYSTPDMMEVDFPDEFDFSTQNEYRIVDGGIVHDPLPESGDERSARQANREGAQIRDAIRILVRRLPSSIEDDEARSVSSFFKDWDDDEEKHRYEVGDIRQHDGKLYRCREAHEKSRMSTMSSSKWRMLDDGSGFTEFRN